MTEEERDVELGCLSRERDDTRQTIAGLKSKLLRTADAFRTAAVVLRSDKAERDLAKTPKGLAVPRLRGFYPQEQQALPELDDLIRWLREMRATQERLAELDELLPD